jgi:hypothetical protein
MKSKKPQEQKHSELRERAEKKVKSRITSFKAVSDNDSMSNALCISSVKDIREHKRPEDTLRISEERYWLLVENQEIIDKH